MKFLSKLAQVALKVGQVVGIFGPVFTQVVPGSGSVVGRILDVSTKFNEIIMHVELGSAALTSPLAGAEKLRMAIPAFSEAILSSAAIAGKKIGNPTLYREGVEKVASGWADILNSLHEDEAAKLAKAFEDLA